MSWSFDAAVFLTTFLLVLPAELPDKSFIASVVLASRLPRLAVWTGAAAAFAIQVVIAVSAGQLLDLLPRRAVLAVVMALFAFGAVVLLRQAWRASGDEDDEVEVTETPKNWWKAWATTFGLLFAAEWGDLTQLVAAAQSARTGNPLSAGLGAWVALVTVSAAGVLVGSWLRQRINVRWLHLAAGSIMTVLAVLAGLELARI